MKQTIRIAISSIALLSASALAQQSTFLKVGQQEGIHELKITNIDSASDLVLDGVTLEFFSGYKLEYVCEDDQDPDPDPDPDFCTIKPASTEFFQLNGDDMWELLAGEPSLTYTFYFTNGQQFTKEVNLSNDGRTYTAFAPKEYAQKCDASSCS